MGPSENNETRLKYVHLLLAAALLIVFVNFAIGGFGPYLMVLMPAFPFILLSLLPISWRKIKDPDSKGILGAGIGAVVSVIPCTALFAYDMITGWKGGADIGLGLLYMFLPVYSIVFMTIGYFIGELVVMVRHRDASRLPDMFRTAFLLSGVGFCIYFLFKSHTAYRLYGYYMENDPSAAELYEIDLWMYLILAGASLLIPLGVYIFSRKKGKLPGS